MLHFRSALFAALAAISLASPLVAEEAWTEIRAPHVRVVTNGSAEAARQVAIDCERMRGVLAWRFPGMRIDLNAPLTVYAARDFSTLLRLRPNWQDPELFDFYGNWERNIAFADLSSWSKARVHPVYIGYVHELLRQNSWPYPVWLDRGYAQLIGTTSFNGLDVVLGTPTDRWTELKAQPLLPVQRVLNDRPLLGFNPAIQPERQEQVNEAWGWCIS